MADYYVNKNEQPVSGDHEVHKEGCEYMPKEKNRIYLGDFSNCADAVKKAKEEYYDDVNGGAYCIPACHTT